MIKGYRILPIVPISIALAFWLMYEAFEFLASAFSSAQIYIFGGVLAVLLVCGIIKLFRTEIGLFIREHLSEKIKDWCLNVRFVSKEELLAAREEKN